MRIIICVERKMKVLVGLGQSLAEFKMSLDALILFFGLGLIYLKSVDQT